MSDDVTLKINANVYKGWKSVGISRSIETLTGSFTLGLTDNWEGLAQPWPIVPGDKAEILIGSTLIMTGWVDTVSNKIDDKSRTITVGGRDKTGDLVDCSADITNQSYQNIKLDALARLMCKPFDISVIVGTGMGDPFAGVAATAGETVFEILDKRARSRGVLLVSTSEGFLHLTQPGTSKAATALVEGQNVKEFGVELNGKERFSVYKVTSQGIGDTDSTGTTNFRLSARATDSGVKRYRPLVIANESNEDGGTIQQRATYEAIVRAARAGKVTATVQGWRQGDGSLWAPNQLVSVVAPSVGVYDTLLVCSVAYALDDQGGSVTTLEMKRKDAFIPNPSLVAKNDLWRLQYKRSGGT